MAKKTENMPMEKITVTLFEGTEAIERAIQTIHTSGKKLESLIHSAAVSCLVHADVHGDITLANRLLVAIPSLARKNALRDWFLTFGKFSYDVENKTLTFNKKAKTDQEGATNTPFWLFKPEPAYVPFDLQAQILRLVTRAEKAVKDGEKVPTETLEALRGLAA